MLRKVNIRSQNVYPSSIQLNVMPPTLTAFDKTYVREFLTNNPINDTPNVIQIENGPSLIDLNKTRIVTRWKMSKKDAPTTEKTTTVWENTTDDDQIVAVNGIGGVFPKNIDFKLNGQVRCLP